MTKDHEKKPHVVVAHPGTQHSHFLAVGLERAGYLYQYVTRLYYDEKRFPFNLIRFLPNQLRTKIDQQLYSRRHTQLSDEKVKIVGGYAEWIYILLNRALKRRELARKWMRLSNIWFSRQVGRLVAKNAQIVIGTDDSSRDLFSIAKENNVICILDVSIVNRLFMAKLYEEEISNNPEFAPILQDMQPIQNKISYSAEEIKMSDYFFAGSSFVKSALCELGVVSEKVFVVPYGVDLERYNMRDQSQDKDDQLRLLFVGSMVQRKGIMFLLEAVHQLKPYYNISLTLCGGFQKFVLEHPRYRDDFHAIGPIPQMQMPDIYHQADALILPSLAEGFSRVLIEAMASGLPIIASTNSGFADALTAEGKEGFVIPIRDVEAIKEKIVYLYENPDKRRAMGRAAHERAIAYFSWDRYYSDVAKAVQTIWSQRNETTK